MENDVEQSEIDRFGRMIAEGAKAKAQNVKSDVTDVMVEAGLISQAVESSPYARFQVRRIIEAALAAAPSVAELEARVRDAWCAGRDVAALMLDERSKQHAYNSSDADGLGPTVQGQILHELSREAAANASCIRALSPPDHIASRAQEDGK